MSDDEDAVGYKRPPKHSRFKKGQSGNPRGRQPQSKSLDTLMLQELEQKVKLTEGGRTRMVTKRAAIAKRIVSGALNGDPRQLAFIFNYMRERGVAEPFGITLEDQSELTKALEALNVKQRDASDDGETDDGS